MHDISANDHDVVWRVNSRRGVCWCAWDGEVVVYDDESGDTLKLEPLVAELFGRLLDGPATKDELTRHLDFSLDLESEPRLRFWVGRALQRCERSGLVERVTLEDTARSPAPQASMHRTSPRDG